MKNKKTILAIGSIHMSIFCNEEGIQYEPGGESFNFAIAMARSGVPVRVVTAMKRGGINRMLKQAMEIAGIESWITWNEQLPQGGHFVFTESGKKEFSYTSTPIDRVSFPSGVMDRGLTDAGLVYIDCNLSPKTLVDISRRVFRAGLPLVVMSTEKTHRILDVLPYADIVFLSRSEWESFQAPPPPPEIAGRSFRTIFIRYSHSGSLDIMKIDGTILDTIVVPEDVPEFSWIASKDILASEICRLVFIEGKVLSVAIMTAIKSLSIVERDILAYMRGFRSIDRLVGDIHDLAEIDPTTRAYTKSSIMDFLRRTARASDGSKGTLLVFFDLNRFKQVNDTLGHDHGDAVLRDFVAMVSGSIRSEIDRIGRIGGDEFLLVIPNGCENKENIPVINRSVQKRFKDLPFASLCPSVHGFGASVGVASVFSEDEIQEAVGMADKLMYADKKDSRSGYARR